jgi:hypothetical protein
MAAAIGGLCACTTGGSRNGLWHGPWHTADDEVDRVSASTIYALAHYGLVAFVDATTVSPTPKGEALAVLLDETTMVTRRGSGMVIS